MVLDGQDMVKRHDRSVCVCMGDICVGGCVCVTFRASPMVVETTAPSDGPGFLAVESAVGKGPLTADSGAPGPCRERLWAAAVHHVAGNHHRAGAVASAGASVVPSAAVGAALGSPVVAGLAASGVAVVGAAVVGRTVASG
jgi:hypothetical protein